jgi:hypothetical protein
MEVPASAGERVDPLASHENSIGLENRRAQPAEAATSKKHMHTALTNGAEKNNFFRVQFAHLPASDDANWLPNFELLYDGGLAPGERRAADSLCKKLLRRRS